jgi:hypothetical protein
MHTPARRGRSPPTRGTRWAATASCSATRSPGTWLTGGPIDTFEGTEIMQTLIVGGAITGIGAFA